MWYSCPLVCYLFINNTLTSKILFIKLSVYITQIVSSKDIAFFDHFMGCHLEFSKHCLSEQSTLKLLKIMVKKIFSSLIIFVILTAFQQIIHKKCFITCRGNLCNEYLVTSIYIWLVRIRIVCMHCVTHLVDNSKYII